MICSYVLQNLDISKLEQSGRLEIIQLESSCHRSDASDKLNVYNWDELIKWQNNLLSSLPQSANATAVLVDDLDILELLAPSATAARNLVTRFLAVLRNTSPNSSSNSSNNQEDGSVSHVVCFGRHPQETTAQLSSLGSGVVSASNRCI